MTWEGAVITGLGAFCGLAGALGYGFKKMVDLLGDELKAQRAECESIRCDIIVKIEKHMAESQKDREKCRCWKEANAGD